MTASDRRALGTDTVYAVDKSVRKVVLKRIRAVESYKKYYPLHYDK